MWVWVFYKHECLCITCLHGAPRGEKRVSETLELELQMNVGRHVGSGNQAWILCNIVSVFNHRDIYCPQKYVFRKMDCVRTAKTARVRVSG